MTRLLAPTLREDPAEAEVISHKLMVRAGYIKKLAAGLYDFMPLGWKVVLKITNIIRGEMDRAEAQEVFLPAVIPAELWQESGRWQVYGKELLRFKDRHDRECCIGPTHEEVITDLVRRSVKSYKELPINLYQIQSKFRDEIRPRFGVMRAREFMMKDAYSFHADEDGLEKEYQNMYETYCRIFDRIGLEYKVVEADPGPIGGGFSQEFMVLADTGEDEIVHCPTCNYAASLEMTEIAPEFIRGAHDNKSQTCPTKPEGRSRVPNPEKVSTPNMKTVEELTRFFKTTPDKFIKTLIHQAGDEVFAVLVRGDYAVNEVKLKRLIGREDLKLAEPQVIEKVTGAPVGFAGPIGLKGIKVYADHSVVGTQDAIAGANEADQHLKHVCWERDFKADQVADLRLATPDDICARCGKGKYQFTRGIEVGHIFKLGTKYSSKMQATFLDEKGNAKPFVMGCYGIGVTRIAGAAIEQNNDEFGIIWPASIAPFAAAIVPINIEDPEQGRVAEKLYQELSKARVEILLDDRAERIGVKLKDIDLMGIPLKIIIGPKGLKEGMVELKPRRGAEMQLVKIDNVVDRVAGALAPA
jgi:prolyl-tRNA synthetase